MYCILAGEVVNKPINTAATKIEICFIFYYYILSFFPVLILNTQ